MNLQKTISKIEKYAQKHEKKSRYEHSKRVAAMCAELCTLFRMDSQLGYLTGIGHDICKNLPDKKMIKTAKKDGEGITDYEKKQTYLLHGRAASVKMNRKFKVKNKDVLQAVSVHVYAGIGICELAKILFICDKAEPGRPFSTDEYRAKLFKLSLNDMFITILKESHDYMIRKGYEIYPESLKVYDYYMGGNK